MKKSIFQFLFLSAIVLTIFCACNKEEYPQDPANNDTTTTPDSPQINYAQEVLGTWQVALDKSFELYTEPNYTECSYCNEWANDITLTFNSNDKLHYCQTSNGFTDEWDDQYHVQGDTLLWDTRKYAIKSYDGTYMIIENKVVEERRLSGGTTFESTLIRHFEMTRKN